MEHLPQKRACEIGLLENIGRFGGGLFGSVFGAFPSGIEVCGVCW
jgi:hypothetical protein